MRVGHWYVVGFDNQVTVNRDGALRTKQIEPNGVVGQDKHFQLPYVEAKSSSIFEKRDGPNRFRNSLGRLD